jgi:hypothetical protein
MDLEEAREGNAPLAGEGKVVPQALRRRNAKRPYTLTGAPGELEQLVLPNEQLAAEQLAGLHGVCGSARATPSTWHGETDASETEATRERSGAAASLQYQTPEAEGSGDDLAQYSQQVSSSIGKDMLTGGGATLHRPCIACRQARVLCDRKLPCTRCMRLGMGFECKAPPTVKRGRPPNEVRHRRAVADQLVNGLAVGQPLGGGTDATSCMPPVATSSHFQPLVTTAVTGLPRQVQVSGASVPDGQVHMAVALPMGMEAVERQPMHREATIAQDLGLGPTRPVAQPHPPLPMAAQGPTVHMVSPIGAPMAAAGPPPSASVPPPTACAPSLPAGYKFCIANGATCNPVPLIARFCPSCGMPQC